MEQFSATSILLCYLLSFHVIIFLESRSNPKDGLDIEKTIGAAIALLFILSPIIYLISLIVRALLVFLRNNCGSFFYLFIVGTVTIVVSFIAWHKWLTARRKALTCPHGIYRGKEKKSGNLICPICQHEYEESFQKEARKREIEREVYQMKLEQRKLYIASVNNAMERYRNSIYANEKTIMDMDAYEFEEYISKLFGRMGCQNVKLTPKSNDGGKDFTFTMGDNLYYGECKHYQRSASVGRPMIQKLSGAMTAGHAAGGVFVTTGRYTKEALQEAPRLNIRTIDGNQLFELISLYTTEDDKLECYDLFCPECGENVVFSFFDKQNSYLLCPNGHKVMSAFQYKKDEQNRMKSQGFYRY